MKDSPISDTVCVTLHPHELKMIQEFVAYLENAGPAKHPAQSVLSRIALQTASPTGRSRMAEMGLYGGVLQWCRGNTVPICVYDYDGDEDELPDFDPEGSRCKMLRFEAL